MGRRPYLFSKAVLQPWSLSTIIDRVIEYDAKVKNKKIATNDTLRLDSLIKAMIKVSENEFNSKGSISNKLIDALLSRDNEVTKIVKSSLNKLSGYKYDDLDDLVYYLSWFACTDKEPVYATLDEFAKNIA